MLDKQGRLLGINTIRLEGGLIVAVATDADLREHVQALGRGESPSRASLGLALAPARVTRRMRHAVGLPERDGLLVRGVAEDGPAARAGIETGDVLLAINGRPVESIDQVKSVLSAKPKSVALLVQRDGEKIFVPVKLG